MTVDLSDYRSRFTNLRTDTEQGRSRPHKPSMLLTMISLAENGRLTDNRIQPDPELLELFKSYFAATCAGNDRCTPENPFFYLKSEGFWHLHARPGREAEVDAMKSPGSWPTIVDLISHASVDDALFALVAQSTAREVLRNALINRYFPAKREKVLDIADLEREIGAVRSEWKSDARDSVESTTARKTAFTRTVRQAYDYQCATCGIRFVYEDTTLVDAAHLVPWSESKDDRPQNGLALCKNHHWVMDKRLIAPGPDLKWHVSNCLDDRIQGQKDLLCFDGREILLPYEKRFQPDPAGLEWRMDRLMTP
jgi:putative restriction endonuclease